MSIIKTIILIAFYLFLTNFLFLVIINNNIIKKQRKFFNSNSKSNSIINNEINNIEIQNNINKEIHKEENKEKNTNKKLLLSDYIYLEISINSVEWKIIKNYYIFTNLLTVVIFQFNILKIKNKKTVDECNEKLKRELFIFYSKNEEKLDEKISFKNLIIFQFKKIIEKFKNKIKTNLSKILKRNSFIKINNIIKTVGVKSNDKNSNGKSNERNDENYNMLINKEVEEKDINKEAQEIEILLGFDENNCPVYLKESGLFQNVLITGSIGTGKTSSGMYPITKQLISTGIGMLILDVKGNYYNKVLEMARVYNRAEDIIKIDLSGDIKYNPLDKVNLNANVLAERLKTILLLFSPNNSESFWLDKVEQIISEVIKFIRLYNNYYVTFEELHNIINKEEYYKEKLKIIKKRIYENKYSEKEIFEFNSFFEFYKNEFLAMDDRTKSILKAEISRITQIFVSDYYVNRIFSPKKEEINFFGFLDVIKKKKIVVLNMNISRYTILSKIIATYLKLDFQSEVLDQLQSNSNIETTAFICDEYHEYISGIDSKFYSQSREAKCISVVSTQSLTSIKEVLKSEELTKVVSQSLVNKIWYRCDDPYTIEEAKKLIGREEKERKSITISENSKDSNYSYILNKFITTGANLSESFNTYKQKEDLFDNVDFSQNLNVFEGIVFLSDGKKILRPQKIKMIPEFLTADLNISLKNEYNNVKNIEEIEKKIQQNDQNDVQETTYNVS